MPASTAPAKRKTRGVGATSAAPGENGEKENGATAAGGRRKRAGDGGSKKRKKETNVDEGFEFRVRKSSRISSREGAAVAGEGSNSAPAAETTTVETTVQRLPKTREKPPQLPPDSPTPPVHQAKTKTKKKRDKEKKEKKPAEETRAEQHEPSHPPKARTRKVEKPAEEDVVMATEDTASRMGDDSHSHSRMPRPKDVSKIKLPTSDTPIQRKNQAFRKGPGGERRRSSLGMRGRRASTMMESGIVAEPHSSISHEEFYKHIEEEQMENARMKQLLSWCGRRALDSLQATTTSSDPDGSARHIARVIAEDVYKEISTNGELSTWFTRGDSPAPTTVKKPNPRNEENRAKEEDLKAKLEQLDSEYQSWLTLTSMKPDLSLPSSSTEDPKYLLRPSEAAFANSRTSHQDVLAAARRLVKHHAAEIEFQIDRLADGIHKMQAYGDAADRLAGCVLEVAGDSLQLRQNRVRESMGTDALPLAEVLRSISHTSPSLSAAADAAP